MKVLQINTIVNSGSTGIIAENIGRQLLEKQHQSYVAIGRGDNASQSKVIKINTEIDIVLHGIKSLVLDRHGFGSTRSTKKLIKLIDNLKIDVCHIHNLHGYYIDVNTLFTYLKSRKLPVVWTFHDSWPFTGHCTYFDSISCDKWKTHCRNCPKSRFYPKSIFIDNSLQNFKDKKHLFCGIKKLQIVTPSNWLKSHVKDSFLKNYPIRTIPNGINMDEFINTGDKYFYEEMSFDGIKVILGVANEWDRRKGLDDFIKLSEIIDSNYLIVLIGLKTEQIKKLPTNILGLSKTSNTRELANWYSNALVYVNPTWQDNFPTTNLEALACGTPVITYNTGGSPEAIDENTGFVIAKGDIYGIVSAVQQIESRGKNYYSQTCRRRAERNYDKDIVYSEYINLYEKMIG